MNTKQTVALFAGILLLGIVTAAPFASAIKYSNPANAFYGSWPYMAIMSPANPPIRDAVNQRYQFKIDIYDQEGIYVNTRTVNLRDNDKMYVLDENIRQELYQQFESDMVNRSEAVNYLYSFYNYLPIVAACIQR